MDQCFSSFFYLHDSAQCPVYVVLEATATAFWILSVKPKPGLSKFPTWLLTRTQPYPAPRSIWHWCLLHLRCNTGLQQLWAAGHPTAIPVAGAKGQLAAKGRQAVQGRETGTRHHHQQKEQNHKSQNRERQWDFWVHFPSEQDKLFKKCASPQG